MAVHWVVVVAVALMLGVTAVWGWTFVLVKDAVALYPPLLFLALRFSLAALVLLPAAWRRLTPGVLLPGALAGGVLALGYWFQTVGLRFTQASTAGLITGLFVVFTPLLDRLIFRQRLPLLAVPAVALACLGLFLLSDASTPEARWGNLLVLGCAICFAAHIVLLGRFAAPRHPLALAAAQVASGATLFIMAALAEVALPAAGAPVRWPPPGPVLWALAVTALLATCVGFAVQSWVQQRLSATHTALLLTSEPVFATLFGVWLAGDRFTLLRTLGALAVLAGLMLGEIGRTRVTRDG